MKRNVKLGERTATNHDDSAYIVHGWIPLKKDLKRPSIEPILKIW